MFGGGYRHSIASIHSVNPFVAMFNGCVTKDYVRASRFVNAVSALPSGSHQQMIGR